MCILNIAHIMLLDIILASYMILLGVNLGLQFYTIMPWKVLLYPIMQDGYCSCKQIKLDPILRGTVVADGRVETQGVVGSAETGSPSRGTLASLREASTTPTSHPR